MKKHLQKIKSQIKARPKHFALAFIILFGLIGTGALLRSQAATPSFSVEPETGTVTSPATIVNDPTASGGKAIAFGGAISASSGFHTCYPNAFCNSSNTPVTLNGFNIRFVGQATGYTTLAQLQRIKAEGFNTVRYAMRWNTYQTSKGTGGFDTNSFEELNTAVTNAKTAGIYVILDPIHYGGDGTNCSTSGCIPSWATGTAGADRIQNNAQDYIQKIASDYANEPDVVAIDLANEVRASNYDNDSAIISMYNTLITQARAKAPNKILMIESTTGDKLFSADTVAGLVTKTNIVYSFHDYYGGGCNNGYSSGGSVCGNDTYEDGGGYPSPSYASLNAHVTANLTMLADPRLKLPLFIGEYSIAIGLPGADQWRKDMTQVFKNNNNISRTFWLFYNQGPDPAPEDLSATDNNNGAPGAWRAWVNELL